MAWEDRTDAGRPLLERMWHPTGSQERKGESESEVAQLCPTLWDPMDCKPTRLLHPWEFPDKSTRMCCHFLFQGIFPTQGSNLHLLHCRQMLHPLSYRGNPQERMPQNPSEFSLKEEVVMWNTPLSSAPYQCLVISGAQGLLSPTYRSSWHMSRGTWSHQLSAQESCQWRELTEGHV